MKNSANLPQPRRQKGTCPFCHTPIEKSATLCRQCDVPLVAKCPDCQEIVDVEWKTCPTCDYPLPDCRYGSVYFTLLALENKDRRRFAAALELLRLAEKLDPDQPDLYRQLGEVLILLKQPYEAMTALKMAIEKEPDQIGPYLALGDVLRQEGYWEQAEEIYRRGMATVPASSETYYALGDLFLTYDHPAEARQYLKQAVKIDPGHGLAWARLGQLYERTKKSEAAVGAYQQATQFLVRDSMEGQLAWERLQTLRPGRAAKRDLGWAPLLQYMSGPVLVCLGVVLVNAGFRPGDITWTGWAALLVGVAGGFLAVSAFLLPKNPVMRAFTGHPAGLDIVEKRWRIGSSGILLELAALVLLLLPL